MGNCSSKKGAHAVVSHEEVRPSADGGAKIDALAQKDVAAEPTDAGGNSGPAAEVAAVTKAVGASTATAAVDGADAPLPPGKRIVFVLGGPGSGKGTQCEKLRQRFGFEHLSVGDLLREEAESGSPLAERLTDIMRRGDLVPDNIVIGLLRRAITDSDPPVNLVDGFPRALKQAMEFEREVAPPAAVLVFDCSDDTMRKRILERAKTSGRPDDNEETVANRLRVFHEQTEPVKQFYEQRGLLWLVDAEPPMDKVFEKVSRLAEELLAASAPLPASSTAAEDSTAPDSRENGAGEVPIAVGARAAPSAAAEVSEPQAVQTGAVLTPLPAAPAAAADEQRQALPAEQAGAATSEGTVAAVEDVEGSPAPAGGAETEAVAQTEVPAEQGAANGKATRRTTARKTGPGATSRNVRRSVSPTKRRTTGKAPAAPAASAPAQLGTASTPPAAGSTSSGDVKDEGIVAQEAALSPSEIVAVSPDDDPLIAEAKRIAAQALSGGKPAAGSAVERSRTRTRSGSIAASGGPRKTGTATEAKKPFSWLYGSEEAQALV